MSTPSSPVPAEDSVNLSVLRGACSAAPELRILASGARLATLALRCPAGDGRSTSVPVTVWDPPAWLQRVGAGDELVVLGRSRRRFYRQSGGVGSRVDVEAEVVGRAGERRRVDLVRRRAQEVLDCLG